MESVPWYIELWPLLVAAGFLLAFILLLAFYRPKIRAVIIREDKNSEPWAVCSNCTTEIGEMDTMRICHRCRAPLCSNWCIRRHRKERHSRKDAA